MGWRRARSEAGFAGIGGAAQVPRRTRLANRTLTMPTNILYGGRLTDMETAYKVGLDAVYALIKFRMTSDRI
jgi:hypothetical protein